MNKLKLQSHYIIENQKIKNLILPFFDLTDEMEFIFGRKNIQFGDIYFSTNHNCFYINLMQIETMNSNKGKEKYFNYFSFFLFNEEIFSVLKDKKANNIDKFYKTNLKRNKEFIYIGNYYLEDFESIDSNLKIINTQFEIKRKNELNQDTMNYFKDFLRKEYDEMMELTLFEMNESKQFYLKELLYKQDLLRKLKENKLNYFIKMITLINLSNKSKKDKNKDRFFHHTIVGNELSKYLLIKNQEVIKYYYLCLNNYGSATLFDVNEGYLLDEGLDSRKMKKFKEYIEDGKISSIYQLINKDILHEVVYLMS